MIRFVHIAFGRDDGFPVILPTSPSGHLEPRMDADKLTSLPPSVYRKTLIT
jgi:hypothetical protein